MSDPTRYPRPAIGADVHRDGGRVRLRVLKKCEQCGADFMAEKHAKPPKGRFCSRSCVAAHSHITPRRPRGGGYSAVHKWLRNNFGKADRCENASCPGTCSKFQWALRRGCAYEHKRENFIQLCQSCHEHYDMNDAWRANNAASRRGRPLPVEQRERIANGVRRARAS